GVTVQRPRSCLAIVGWHLEDRSADSGLTQLLQRIPLRRCAKDHDLEAVERAAHPCGLLAKRGDVFHEVVVAAALHWNPAVAVAQCPAIGQRTGAAYED